jgi:parallel beta-helix repeat protein
VLVDAGGLAEPAQVEVTSSQIVGTGGTGVSLENAGGSIVAGNTINLATGRGILLDTCRGVQVTGNAIRATGMAGIALVGSDGCQIAENVVRLAGTDGLILDAESSDNTVTSNQATESGLYGLQVGGDRNVLSSNLLGGNADWGLFFNANSQDNVFRTNVARGNTGGACAGGSASFCDLGTNNASALDNYAPNVF